MEQKKNSQITRSNGLLSLESFTGRPPITNWRWRKRGWIEPVCIAGRFYVTPAEQERFLRRAKSGEFSKGLHGACKATVEGGAA